MTHTPTPWKLERFGEDIQITGGDEDIICNDTEFYPASPSVDDMEHIVKCVNLHDELLEALIEMVNTFAGYEEKTFEEKIETALNASKVIQKAGAL